MPLLYVSKDDLESVTASVPGSLLFVEVDPDVEPHAVLCDGSGCHRRLEGYADR